MTLRHVVLLTTALAGGGCAASALDRFFEAGQYESAVRAYEADPSLAANDRALYRLALSYAAAGTDVYDPERARALLAQLETRYPESRYRAEVTVAGGLLGAIVALRDTVEGDRELLDSLRADIRAVEAANAALEDSLGAGRRRIAELTAAAQRLEAEVEAKDSGLQRLEDELRRLKNIDLGRPTN